MIKWKKLFFKKRTKVNIPFQQIAPFLDRKLSHLIAGRLGAISTDHLQQISLLQIFQILRHIYSHLGQITSRVLQLGGQIFLIQNQLVGIQMTIAQRLIKIVNQYRSPGVNCVNTQNRAFRWVLGLVADAGNPPRGHIDQKQQKTNHKRHHTDQHYQIDLEV
ncbi:hypothetical protein BpHYR1_018108 [Brachionus plicatilis]|uniref:Uncharacterized protein n=1 Tax=Brachionus plicatilis TaxID=10195 RepID=A0A3M7T2G4_BRAPC|nr:hypothetical protein BpHYR1_018108 [Brachionus plicatilis]